MILYHSWKLRTFNEIRYIFTNLGKWKNLIYIEDLVKIFKKNQGSKSEWGEQKRAYFDTQYSSDAIHMVQATYYFSNYCVQTRT